MTYYTERGRIVQEQQDFLDKRLQAVAESRRRTELAMDALRAWQIAQHAWSVDEWSADFALVLHDAIEESKGSIKH